MDQPQVNLRDTRFPDEADEETRNEANQCQQALVVLYTDPARAAQANQWLLNFQNTSSAWPVSLYLLRTNTETSDNQQQQVIGAHIKTFAATVIKNKAQTGDLVQMSAIQRAGLFVTLLRLLPTLDASSSSCVAQALVKLLVQQSEERGQGPCTFLRTIIEPSPFLCLLFSLLPEEIDRSATLSVQRRADFKQDLANHVPLLFDLVENAFYAGQYSLPALNSLQNWAESGVNISIGLLSERPSLYQVLLRALVDPQYSNPATEALIEITASSSNTEKVLVDPFRPILVALHNIYPWIAGVSTESSSTDVARATSFCRLAARVGNTLMSAVVEGTEEGLALVELMQKLTGHTIYNLVQEAFLFWDSLTELLPPQRHPSLREPLFSRLLPLFVQQASYPRSENVEEDEFRRHRRHVKDMLVLAAGQVGAGKSVGDLLFYLFNLTRSGSAVEWRIVESLVFSLECIAPEVEPNESIVSLFLEFLESPQLQPYFTFTNDQQIPSLAIDSSLRVIGAYARFGKSERGDSLLHRSFSLLLPHLAPLSNSPEELRVAAASSLYALCVKSGQNIVRAGFLPGLLQVLCGSEGPPLRLPPEAASQITEGLVRVAAFVPNESDQLSALAAIGEPVLKRLEFFVQSWNQIQSQLQSQIWEEVDSHLNELATFFQFLPASDSLLSLPAQVLARALPSLRELGRISSGRFLQRIQSHKQSNQQDDEEEENLLRDVICRLALVYKKTLVAGKADLGREAIEAVLSDLEKIYRESGGYQDPDISSAVFDGFFAAAETCGKVWPVSDSLRVALDLLLETALSGWSSSDVGSPGLSCRDEKCNLFHFLHRGLLLCPEVILSLNTITRVISLAVESLSTQWQGVLVAPELGRASCVFLSRLPASFLSVHSSSCLESVLRAIVVGSSREQLPGYADLFLNLINSQPQTVIPAIDGVLDRLVGSEGLTNLVEKDVRNLFVGLVGRLRSIPRRFKLMVNDFGQICRGTQPSQILLDYTLS